MISRKEALQSSSIGSKGGGELDVDGEGIGGVSRLCELVLQQMLLFRGLFAFSILVCCPEDQVHDEDLISDEDGDEEYGIILGLLGQAIDEDEDEIALVDDLSKQHHFVHNQFRPLSSGVTDERVIEDGQENLGHVEAAAHVLNVEIALLLRGKVSLAAEDIEEEDADGDGQSPDDDELELRPHEEDAPHALDVVLAVDLNQHPQHHTDHANTLKDVHLIWHSHVVPGQVVQDATRQEEPYLQGLQGYGQGALHGTRIKSQYSQRSAYQQTTSLTRQYRITHTNISLLIQSLNIFPIFQYFASSQSTKHWPRFSSLKSRPFPVNSGIRGMRYCKQSEMEDYRFEFIIRRQKDHGL